MTIISGVSIETFVTDEDDENGPNDDDKKPINLREVVWTISPAAISRKPGEC